MDYLPEDDSSKVLRRLSGEELCPEERCEAEEEEEGDEREGEDMAT